MFCTSLCVGHLCYRTVGLKGLTQLLQLESSNKGIHVLLFLKGCFLLRLFYCGIRFKQGQYSVLPFTLLSGFEPLGVEFVTGVDSLPLSAVSLLPPESPLSLPFKSSPVEKIPWK